MSLDAQSTWQAFRKKGLWGAVLFVPSAVALGLIDQFTGRVIPSLTEGIDDYFNPPEFIVGFSVPVERIQAVEVSLIGSAAPRPFATRDLTPRRVIIEAGPGVYDLRVRRVHNGLAQVLPALIDIGKRGELKQVDTAETNWADEAVLTGSSDSLAAAGKVTSDAEATPPPKSGDRLSGTRWTVAGADYAMIATAEDHLTRVVLASALPEVGVSEFGSDAEKRRILNYWTAVPGWRDHVQLDRLDDVPWSGAFLAWVVSKAGGEPPEGAAQNERWRSWGADVAPTAALPGMVATFRFPRSGESPAAGRHLSGIILRQQPDCTEVVAANIANRVVITCVAATYLLAVRRPVEPIAAQSGEAAPPEGE